MGENSAFTRRSFLGMAGAAVGSMATIGVAAGSPGASDGPDRTEYIVGVSATESDPKGYVKQFLKGGEDAEGTNQTLNTVVVGLPETAADRAHENFVARLERADAVKYVEENGTLTTQVAPNDPYYGYQYADQQVNAPEAWDVTFGDPNVTIAVVDQGVTYDHPDLDGNMDDSVSNHGRDFVDDDDDPYPDNTDDEFHGTAVAGIAAAEVDNGEGATGIGNSSILAGRALSSNGSGSAADVADAVTWAADQGVDVINLSLGGDTHSETVKNAVSYAADNGSLVVAAAGNDGRSSVSYPAAYSECLAVAALDPDETLAAYSNSGSSIELAAPGTNVVSTSSNGGYVRVSGTSMAAPIVAGVAGLTLAEHDLTNRELRDHLKATAADVGLSDDEQGAGRVDAGNAMTTEPDVGTVTSTRSFKMGSLDGSGDDNCWTYGFEYDDPSRVVLELHGPSDTDFDLYVNDRMTSCPYTWWHDHRSRSTNSEETITIDDPDDSTDLDVLVHSAGGSGLYTLTYTEYQ